MFSRNDVSQLKLETDSGLLMVSTSRICEVYTRFEAAGEKYVSKVVVTQGLYPTKKFTVTLRKRGEIAEVVAGVVSDGAVLVEALSTVRACVRATDQQARVFTWGGWTIRRDERSKWTTTLYLDNQSQPLTGAEALIFCDVMEGLWRDIGLANSSIILV